MTMPAEWNSFLQARGAHIDAGHVLDFGTPEQEATAALENNIVTDLSFLTVIKITGTDATGFLQGQFSSDIKQLSDGDVQLSSWCNPKGQVIASFILTRLNGEYFLLLPAQMKDRFIKRLRMYVLRANVIVEDDNASQRCIGIKYGGDLSTNIGVLHTAATSGKAVQQEGLILVPVPVSRKRWIIIGAEDSLREIWTKLSHAFIPVGSHYWDLFDVLDGLPWISDATTEAFLPQLLNMDQLQAVSFNKGCFPGQEVIARLQHRGKIKQRLVIANLDSEININPGIKIYQDDGEQSIGTIINSVKHPADGVYVLAILDIAHGTPDQLILKNDNARFIQITAPPYLITT